MADQTAQAAIEWVALIALVTFALAGALALAPAPDGRSFGGALAHRLACAVKGRCDDGDRALVRAYGASDAELVRRHLPSLVFEPGERQVPVDWRRCRDVACAVAADDRDLDVHRSEAGRRVTAFTRLQRDGDRRYIQYWLYYPDSNTTLASSDRVWRLPGVRHVGALVTGSERYPGFHPDDWEAATVRVEADGRAAMRVTSHGHWQWCKHSDCADRWGPATGWTRVSRGSHANHVPAKALPGSLRRRRPSRYRPLLPGHDLRERTATAAGIRLVPLETLDREAYRRLDPGISPPWEKDAYRNPTADGS